MRLREVMFYSLMYLRGSRDKPESLPRRPALSELPGYFYLARGSADCRNAAMGTLQTRCRYLRKSIDFCARAATKFRQSDSNG
jgi:hypothetical protein